MSSDEEDALDRASDRRDSRGLRPLLVTGSHRSGSTWIGQLLAAESDFVYVHEPFNPRVETSWLAHSLDIPFLYVSAETEWRFQQLKHDFESVMSLRYPLVANLRRVAGHFPNGARAIARSHRSSVLGRIRRQRPLIKDPLALLASPWLAQTFGLDILVTVRHPAAFALSLAEKSWSFDFGHFLRQRELMEGPFSGWSEEIEAAANALSFDILDQAGLLWKVLYHYVYHQLRPLENCQIVRHEDVMRDPESFQRAVLSGDDVDTQQAASVASSRGEEAKRFTGRWRKELSTRDIQRLRAAVGDEASWLYSPDDWPQRRVF